MLARTETTTTTYTPSAPRRRPPTAAPAPVIARLGDDRYEVHSRRSGNTYLARVAEDGEHVVCGCPARGACYHAAYVLDAHRLHLLAAALVAAPADPLRMVRRKLELISRLAAQDWYSVEDWEDVGRAAHDALCFLDAADNAGVSA